MRSRPQVRTLSKAQHLVSLWSGTLMIALSIFVFATMPEKSAQRIDPSAYSETTSLLFWKLGHVLGFALFAGSLTLTISATIGQHIPNFRTQIAAIFVALAVAATTEILQIFIPGRTPRVLDVGFDMVGALIGIWFAVKWRKTTNRKRA